MFVENSALISQVLGASAGRAPDMTHALYSLGNGDMGAGIVTLWKAGQKAGVMKGACATALAFSIGIGVSTMLLSRFYQDRLKEVERNTADACLELRHPYTDNGAGTVLVCRKLIWRQTLA